MGIASTILKAGRRIAAKSAGRAKTIAKFGSAYASKGANYLVENPGVAASIGAVGGTGYVIGKGSSKKDKLNEPRRAY